ncbi:MAG: AI-2E family transporter [bacterium]
MEKNSVTRISISTGSIIRVFPRGARLLPRLVLAGPDAHRAHVHRPRIIRRIHRAVLEALRHRTGLGIVILYVLSILALAGVFYLFAPLLITEVYNFSTFLSTYIPNSSIINYFQNDAFSGAKDIINNLSHSLSLTTLLDTSKAFITNLSGGFFQTLSAAFGNFFNVVLIVIISFYLSRAGEGYREFPAHHPADKIRELRRRPVGALAQENSLVGQGPDADQSHHRRAAVSDIVAHRHPIRAPLGHHRRHHAARAVRRDHRGLSPLSRSRISSGGISMALIVAGSYLIVHQFETFLFTPLIIKRVVGLTPLVVILSVLIGFELGGFWGMVLSIPVAVFIMELTNDIESVKSLRE